ncbi:MAG: FAD:protein FMN transferase [Eubacterium sp.]|nr:FAD:protein FMN transferase [Eubacterium sp.]
MRYKIIYYLFIFMLIITQFSGCVTESKLNEPRTYTHFCFDTVCTITIYSSKQKDEAKTIDACFNLCDQFENLFDKHNTDSDIYKINSNTLNGTRTKKTASNNIKVSPETLELIKQTKYYSKLSKGAFDITISPIVDLWDINNNPHIPEKKEILKTLKYVDYKDITIKDNTIKLSHKNQALDLGGIAKGYAVDQIKKLLLANKITSAVINFGGNILTIGSNNGKDFNIGIIKPFGENANDYSAKLKIKDMSVVTSGIYERYFKKDNKIYHHILNPKTGYPVENNLYSVTIISKNSIDGDALSTSAFVIGLSKGLSLINSLDNTYAVFITKDYKLHLSDGLNIDSDNVITIAK